jgi:uncharacterized phage-like protein YoqJ
MFKAHKIHGNINMLMSKTACFTGHRPPQIGGYGINPTAQEIKGWIIYFICTSVEMNQHNTFISGMAQGVDTIAAEAILECRDERQLPVQLICAIPFLKQSSIWPPHARTKWDIITNKANAVVEVSSDPTDKHDAVKKLQLRNQWMVDHSSLCLAVWTGVAGGTANCVKYAQQSYKNIVVYDPNKRSSRIINNK